MHRSRLAPHIEGFRRTSEEPGNRFSGFSTKRVLSAFRLRSLKKTVQTVDGLPRPQAPLDESRGKLAKRPISRVERALCARFLNARRGTAVPRARSTQAVPRERQKRARSATETSLLGILTNDTSKLVSFKAAASCRTPKVFGFHPY
jgi:hypothetical protein